MLNNFVLILSLRYFLAKKNEKFVSIISAISLIGITIGVSALIIVMSVMNGFHIELTSNIIGLNGDITVTPVLEKIENHDSKIKELSEKDFIKKVTPMVTGQALALGKTTNSGVMIKGIDLKDLKHKGPILDNVWQGNFANYEGLNTIAIGSEVAGRLGVRLGHKIKMIAPTLLPTVFGSMPRAKDFEVVAIFNSGLYDYDAAVVLMPVLAAQSFLSIDGFNLIEIDVDDSEKAAKYSRQIRKDLGFGVYVKSWGQDNQQFLNALEVERTVMFVILSLIMMVAAFNIISSLFMVVKDKTTDIAILRTMGASNKQVMMIFMINGLLIGIIGTVIGVIVGLLFSYNIEKIRNFLETISGTKLFEPAIYFLYTLPSVVRISDVIIVASLSIIFSLLATIYPAYKAASLNPIEAMRYE